jgi:hypothetical protein
VHNYPHPGTNYYRLKIVDLDESFIYSNIVALDFGVQPGISYNWETGNTIRIMIEAAPDGQIDADIYDASGKLFWNKKSIILQNGSALINLGNIDIPKLSLLRINIGNNTGKTIQIIKP